ncbi:PH domain-containing protein [Streptomyces sp. NPDC050988]|uniref:PH domain-containing protein n=1 Tax=Streptomyces sp. NPDC050988 TaxID=3365637 RepID=UPI0037B79E25
MSYDRLPREYRIRPAQTRAMIIGFSVGLVPILLPVLLIDELPQIVKIVIVVPLLALFGWLVWAAGRCATTADLKAIRIRGLVGRHALAWEDIQELHIEHNPGALTHGNGPELTTYAYGSGGRRALLPYLDDRHVDVEREVALLREIWHQLRGEDWTPDPSVAARIDRSTARKSALGCGLIAMFLSIAPLFVVGLLPLFLDMPEAVEAVLSPKIILVGPPIIFLVTAFMAYRVEVSGREDRS